MATHNEEQENEIIANGQKEEATISQIYRAIHVLGRQISRLPVGEPEWNRLVGDWLGL